MIENKFQSIQRSVRAALSFYSRSYEAPNEKYNEITNFLIRYYNKRGINNNINKKKIHLLFSKKILDLILNKNLLNFLQNSFVQKIFFIHNRVFLLFYLKDLFFSKKWKFWKNLLKENKIGSPVRYFLFPFTSGNKIFQTYHLNCYEKFSNVSLYKYDYIFEFGGGYGNMAHTFHKINNNVKYIIFDTYEVTLLQYYYLNMVGCSVKFDKVNNGNVLLVHKISDIKKILSDMKSKNKKKLLIANWSISETPLNFRKKIFCLFKFFDNQLISYQKSFENVNNIKYFKTLQKFNIKLGRTSAILNINNYPNNFYLFSYKK